MTKLRNSVTSQSDEAIALPASVRCLIALTAADLVPAQEKWRVAISNFSASNISMHIAQKRGFYTEEGMATEVPHPNPLPAGEGNQVWLK